ncbi:MAG: glycosyltransferase, partial [Lacunisphaera sp.]
MRILHIILSSGTGGSERYCADLASRQAAEGHDVHVAGIKGAPLIRTLGPAVKFHAFHYRLFCRFGVRQLIAELAPEIIHGHLSAACKLLANPGRDVPTVATLHVGYKKHQHDELMGLICVNHTQLAQLAGYRGLSCVIPNWIPQAAPSHPPTADIRDELGLSDEFLIGSAGRLHRSKGMDVLMAAFQATMPAQASLVIVGEGPERKRLERLRAGDSRIHLVGYRSDIYATLRGLDLFVSASREESFGLAIIEAMSVGLSIIATATDGPSEFLANQPVPLVQPGSVEALGAALSTAYHLLRSQPQSPIHYDLSFFDSKSR